MSAVEILRQARELIADKSRWTQEGFARTASGRPIGPKEDGAVCWCAEGSVRRQKASPNEILAAIDILHNASFRLYGCNIVAVNDGNGIRVKDPHAAVLRAFDLAIKERDWHNA